MPKRDFAKEQTWKEKLENWKSSGLSCSTWCKKNNEKFPTFKYWQKKLNEHAIPFKFEELKDSCSYSVEIRKREISICLPNGFDQKTLKDCLAAIEKAPC